LVSFSKGIPPGVAMNNPDYIDKDGKRKLIYLSNSYGYTDVYSHTDKKKKANPLIKGERNAGYESLHFLQTGFNINSQGQLVLVAKSGSQDVLRVINIENQYEGISMQQSDLVTIQSPKWSPDNTKILFSAQNEAGYTDIYLWEINKEQVIRLTIDLYADRSPCFDPTGKWIVFESDRTTDSIPKGSNLFLLDSDSKEIIQIIDNNAINSKPVWSNQDPDIIYFLSDITEDVQTDFGTYHPYLANFTPSVPMFTVEPHFSNVENFSQIYGLSSVDSILLIQNHLTVKKNPYKQLNDVLVAGQ